MQDPRYNNRQANVHRGWLREIGKIPAQDPSSGHRPPVRVVPMQGRALSPGQSRMVVLRDSVGAVLDHAFGLDTRTPAMVAHWYRVKYPELYDWLRSSERER